MSETKPESAKTTQGHTPKEWACEDCGKPLTFKQAERQLTEPCIKCNSTLVVPR